MKLVLRSREHLVKEATKHSENDGYKFAVITKEEATYGRLAEAEWQCDTLIEALNFIEDLEFQPFKFHCAKEYVVIVEQWRKGSTI